jgi:hypothetical protein
MEERKLFGVEEQRPAYEVPQVITYTEEEILEELGPAQAVVSPGGGINP